MTPTTAYSADAARRDDRETRMRFMGIDAQTGEILRTFWKVVEPEIPAILEGFYQHVMSVPQLASMIGSDMPRLKNVPYLEPGTPIYVEDLEAWEKKSGVKIASGDAVLVRTGRWARRAQLGPWNVGQNQAGLHASVAPWIKARGVALLGGDVASDVVPSGVEGITLPIHTLMITGLGVNLLDNQDLEALGETAARLNRWEFMLTVNPVPVTGGTGFPLNAIAMF